MKETSNSDTSCLFNHDYTMTPDARTTHSTSIGYLGSSPFSKKVGGERLTLLGGKRWPNVRTFYRSVSPKLPDITMVFIY